MYGTPTGLCSRICSIIPHRAERPGDKRVPARPASGRGVTRPGGSGKNSGSSAPFFSMSCLSRAVSLHYAYTQHRVGIDGGKGVRARLFCYVTIIKKKYLPGSGGGGACEEMDGGGGYATITISWLLPVPGQVAMWTPVAGRYYHLSGWEVHYYAVVAMGLRCAGHFHFALYAVPVDKLRTATPPSANKGRLRVLLS